MNIDLSIQISLSRETLDVLRQFTPDMHDPFCNCPAQQEDLKTTVENYVVDFLERLQKHAKKPVEEPKPEPAQEPVREEKAPQAAPETTAQAETEEITDAALRKAVKAAKDQVGGQSVKDLFGEFGIRNSSECPQERRSDLLARLNKLAA